jgi:hypothetical protein
MADDATFGFAFDTAGMEAATGKVEDAKGALKELGGQAEETGKKLDEHVKKTKETGKTHEEAAKGVREHKKAVAELEDAHKKLTSSSEEARKKALEHRDALKEAAKAAEDLKKHTDAIHSYRATGSVHPHHENVGHEASDVRGALYGINRALNRRRYGIGIAAERATEFIGDKFGASALGVAEIGAVGLGISILVGKLVELGQEAIKAADAAQQAQAKFMGIRRGATGAGLYEGVEQDSYRAFAGGEAYRAGALAFGRANPAMSNGDIRAYTAGAYRLNAASGGDDKSLTDLSGTMASAIGDNRIDLKELGGLEKIVPQLPALLGQSRVKLDEMAASGQLTAKAFADMLAIAGPGLDKTIDAMPDGFHKSSEKMKNEWERLLKDLGESTGLMALGKKVAESLAGGMSATAQAIEYTKEASPEEGRHWAGGSAMARRWAESNSRRYGVPFKLSETILYQESRGNLQQGYALDPKTGKPMGGDAAYGPMQVTAAAARQMGYDPRDRFNPAKNMEIGARYLGSLAGNGDWAGAARKYIAGPGNVARGTGQGPITERYVAGATASLSNDDWYAGLGDVGTSASALGGKAASARASANEARKAAGEAAAKGMHAQAANLNALALQHDEEARQAEVEMRNLREPLTPFGTQGRTLDQRESGLGDGGISAEAASLYYEQSRAGRPGSLGDARSMVGRGRVLNLREASISQRFRAGQAGLLADAQLSGAGAVRRAQIDQQVGEQSYSLFGAAGPQSAAAVKALGEFAQAVTKASDAALRSAYNQQLASEREQSAAAINIGMAGGGNGVLLAQRQNTAMARLNRYGFALGSSAALRRTFAADDIQTAGGAIRALGSQADDLHDSFDLRHLTGDRLRIAQAGQAEVRRLGDRTDLGSSEAGRATIQRAKELAEALEKAKVSTEHYIDAQREVSGGITGAVGGTVRGIGSALVRGQLNPHSLDKILADQLAGAADKMIDALIAKPLERATEGIADKATGWILDHMGAIAQMDPPTLLAAKALTAMDEAAAMATKSLLSLAASAGGGSAGGGGFAAEFANVLRGGGGGTDAGGNFSGSSTPPPDLVGLYAFGGGISGGRPTRMAAKGMLLNRPTSLAGGAVLAGEADAEAVMPLKRGPDGRLGVSGGGGGGGDVHVVVNDMRSGGAPVETSTERGPDGRRMVKMTIRDEVRSGIRGGEHDAAMRDRFGARPQIARR